MADIPSKKVSQTSMTASYKVTPDMADADGRLFGGELLKLVDTLAGITSRNHAGCACVTVSVDRVVFLSEVKVGDTVHLSASVNRSWNSSLETGVRCMRQERNTGKITYCCHSYMTFVAIPSPTTQEQQQQPQGKSQQKQKMVVPKVERETLLQEKRYLLAGRRRAYRMQRRDAWQNLLGRVRIELLQAVNESKTNAKQDGVHYFGGIDINHDPDLIHALELDLVADAYLRKDKDLKILHDQNLVIFEIEDYMEPTKLSLDSVEHHIRTRKETKSSDDDYEEDQLNNGQSKPFTLAKPINFIDTHVLSMHIVRPQHTNSMSNLFGGQLLYWIEQAAEMSANKLSDRTWLTTCLDSMVFKESVKQGQVVYIHAVITKVWHLSVEVYCLARSEPRYTGSPASAEQISTQGLDPDGKKFAAEAFLSLVSVDPKTGRPDGPQLPQLETRKGAIEELNQGADERRRERLDDKRILMAVYT